MKQLFILDSSPRTRAISRPMWITVAATVLIVICVIWGFFGNSKFNDMMNRSSTPVGSTLTFSQTGATARIADFYTDKNESALVARIKPDENANEKLPYKGSDYTVFVKSSALSDYTEIPILFGKMGTDGDMFLILPKPTKAVYSFAIINTLGDQSDQSGALSGSSRSSSSNKSVIKEKESVTKALSDFDSRSSSGKDASVADSSNSAGLDYDATGFRMTLDPAADDDAYKPETLNVNLMKGDEFNFKDFFEKVYVDSAVKKLTKEYNELESAASRAYDRVKDAETRLRMNPSDTTAADILADARSTADKAKRDQQSKADEITYYQTLSYDPAIFQNFQTKAVVA